MAKLVPVARQNLKMGFTTTLTTPALKAFYPQVSTEYCYSMRSIRIASNHNHPLHLKVMERYKRRTDPFWWNMIASLKNLGPKATVRNWMIRKAKISFVQALQECGYDRTGVWMDKSKEGENLTGVADLVIAPLALKMSNEELREQSLLFIQLYKKTAKKRQLKADTSGTAGSQYLNYKQWKPKGKQKSKAWA